MERIILGNAIEVLKELPAESIDCCVTSPPYYQLRDYGITGQIGLEQTVEEYISKLVEVFSEVKRVLKPDGTLWVNIADSYAGSRKGGTVLDPFAGSGTVGLVAKENERGFVLIELSPEYSKIIKKRIYNQGEN